MTPDISIISGTRNRPKSLMRMILSACKEATVPTEIIVADASDEFSGPPDVPNYGDHVEHVNIFHESPRLGPNKGYNGALRKATGRYQVYVNDDSEFLEGWDKTAIEFMDAHEDVGCGILWWRDPGWKQWNYQTYRGLLFANFGVVRREVGEEVGWFDEREVFVPALGRTQGLCFYGNDVGIGLKIIDAGYGVVPIPNCKILHHREQDEERQENNRQFVFGPEGNFAGAVLHELWGGLEGIQRLREKQEKFRHLIPNGEWCN